jgi:hypothetical protein
VNINGVIVDPRDYTARFALNQTAQLQQQAAERAAVAQQAPPGQSFYDDPFTPTLEREPLAPAQLAIRKAQDEERLKPMLPGYKAPQAPAEFGALTPQALVRGIEDGTIGEDQAIQALMSKNNVTEAAAREVLRQERADYAAAVEKAQKQPLETLPLGSLIDIVASTWPTYYEPAVRAVMERYGIPDDAARAIVNGELQDRADAAARKEDKKKLSDYTDVELAGMSQEQLLEIANR